MEQGDRAGSGTTIAIDDIRTPFTLREVLRRLLAVLAISGGVWLVHVFARALPDVAVIAVWIVITAGMATALFRRRRIRRIRFLHACIVPASPLSRWLRGGPIMALGAILVAAVLGLILLLSAVRLGDGAAWLVLVAGAPLLVIVHASLANLAGRHVRALYVDDVVWRVAAFVVGALMILALLWVAYRRSYPALGGVTLEQAVWHFVDAERAHSAWLEILLKAAAAKDALRLWLAEQFMPKPAGSLAQATGWLIILAEDLVFVWSYLLLCSVCVIRGEPRWSAAGARATAPRRARAISDTLVESGTGENLRRGSNPGFEPSNDPAIHS